MRSGSRFRRVKPVFLKRERPASIAVNDMPQLPIPISSLSQLPQWLSNQYANTQAVREGNTHLNFSELNGHCRAVSQWFVEVLDLSAGDRVIVQMPNGIHYPVLIMALW